VALVDGNGVRCPVTRIEDATSCAPGGQERQNGVDFDAHGGDVEGFEPANLHTESNHKCATYNYKNGRCGGNGKGTGQKEGFT
jgi:hypothetical protein